MYRLFKRIANRDLKIYLEKKGFSNYKNGTYICVYNDLFFMLSFGTICYGSVLEFSIQLGAPIVRSDFLEKKNDLDSLPIEGYSISNSKWELSKYNKYDIKMKRRKINKYIEEIKYIYENYLFYHISKTINVGVEKYIRQEYLKLFYSYLEKMEENTPAEQYAMEFLKGGNTLSDWTREDDKRSEQLTKEKQKKEFPYERVKQEILSKMENNRPIYEKEIVKYFENKYTSIVFDKEVLPITFEKIMKDGGLRQKILEIGFNESNRSTIGMVVHGETIFFEKNDTELRVTLEKELFLDFIIVKNNKIHRVNVYDGRYFWFGWLVGKKSIFKENIDKAFKSLVEKLGELESSFLEKPQGN